jgi:hypothetical protein
MMLKVEARGDPRLAPFTELSRVMPLSGRQNGDARLLLELQRKTRMPSDVEK